MRIIDLVVLDTSGNRYNLVPSQLPPPKVDITTKLSPNDGLKTPHTLGSFGENLKERRKREGITQKQLEAISQIKQPNISAIEKGCRQPKVETKEALIHGWEVLTRKKWSY